MYCPGCGAEILEALKYCKRCGANLSGGVMVTEEPSRTPVRSTAMLWPVALVSVVGLVGLFITMSDLSHRVEARALVGVSLFCGMTVVGVVSLLIWLMMRLSGVSPAPSVPSRQLRPITGSTRPKLEASLTPVSSVTENTTRNFDPVMLRDRDE